jgi:hypothetical protein
MSDDMSREDMMAALYGAEEEEEFEGKREQPIQLRLAGKATIITIEGQQIAFPKIEYVEAMERTIRELSAEIERLRSRCRKLELATSKNANIAQAKHAQLESTMRRELDQKMDFIPR